MSRIKDAKRFTKYAMKYIKRNKLTHIDLEIQLSREMPKHSKGFIIEFIRQCYAFGYYKHENTILSLVVENTKGIDTGISILNHTGGL